ncbi:GDP-L-fucose synthase [Halomonas maura]|uniref:GDP-L-fucose synthase n=1 Tax=Halomonas maura TaxID=117606 RepID=UPI0025B40E46|nr:GDP-L-fucose synthase [Halomonas maura]MDN3555221.1 GDP-L-fucose synthase [Halomonas maura]
MEKSCRIFVAGGRGMVGSAICRALTVQGFEQVLAPPSAELDLTHQAAVIDWFLANRPDYVFLAAAKVGGIHANDTYPAEFIHDNLAIETNVIHSAWQCGVKKLCFLGSSCIYPKYAPQPMQEEYLLTGSLEPTNEWYAVAKIAGIKLCQAYRRQYGFDAISLMPTNLYGPGDNFHPANSHVVPAMIRRFHEARETGRGEVTLWGTGSPRREFLHVDDLADACVFLMQHYSDEQFVNVGVGQDLTVLELAQLVARVVGYGGEIRTDPSKPDGTPRKLLDVSRLHAMGWQASIGLNEGMKDAYAWYLEHRNEVPQ